MSRMKQNGYRFKSWIDPRIKLKSSQIHGSGIFTNKVIREGELVIIWGGIAYTKEEIRSDGVKINPQSLIEVREGLYLAGLVNQSSTMDYFMNHSCDPNVWMQNQVTLIARRDIEIGEELTIDYSMFDADAPDEPVVSIYPFNCHCRSRLCRKIITGFDWALPELHLRYKGHVSSYINEQIRKLKLR